MQFTKKLYLNHKIYVILTLLFILLYAIAAILVSLHRFWQYETFFYDFGIYDQAIWLVSKFKAPIINELGIRGRTILSDHFSPSLFIASPLYWITGKQEVIFIFQSICVVFSMLIAYFIGRKYIENQLLIFALIFAYGGYVGMQNAIITDFHLDTIAVLPIMLLFWSIFNKKWKWYWIFLFIFLGLKENMAGIGIAIGFYLFLKKNSNKRIGLITTLISALYYFLSIKFIIPFLKHGSYSYQPSVSESPIDFLFSFFWPSMKLKTLFISFSTFGFLPLFYPPLWLAFLEHFLERFVLNVATTRWQLGFHYNAILSPLMFVSSLEMVIILQEKRKFKILLFFLSIFIILLTFFYHRFYLHGPFGLVYNKEFYAHTKRQGFMNDFIKQIPREGLLMTQNNIAVRFTHQDVILLKNYINYKKYNPDYVAIDLRGGQNGNNYFPLSEEETRKLVDSLLSDKDYQLLVSYANHYIFKKINQ